MFINIRMLKGLLCDTFYSYRHFVTIFKYYNLVGGSTKKADLLLDTMMYTGSIGEIHIRLLETRIFPNCATAHTSVTKK